MDLSIVIPMYNCESTINNVLNSIYSFIDKCDENVEVICVDDGSKDSTANIVEEFIKNNDVFSLIKKENGGVSSARNTGISKAEGKYIMFFDADDIIDSEKLLDVWKKVKPDIDLLFSDVTALKEDQIISGVTKNQKIELYKDLADIGEHRIPIGVNFTIYSRKLLTDNELSFDTNLRVGEDMYFNLRCINAAKNIILTNKKYYYLQEAHSVYLFKKENLDNELYFRKVTDEFFNNQNDNQVTIVNQRMAAKGIIFLVYRYFVPGIFEKQFTVYEASKKLKAISQSDKYEKYISLGNLDKYFSGREKLVRKLLSKHQYWLTIVAGMIMNKLKPEKRY
ncbi:glycosyltransferase family 2 protein [Ligilactobacillus aviarius]|uniref:Glycosyltransferase family 2 protein n=1 Tax=Candidatus Gallilactobacillus intestinavium TaxID=2840838 RepID=A0A9D9E8C4_9LACO|nr:glycosyltransferase family 2 protein [Ligilactobacillus aviarius]MBO8441710.1 glycosyltransferase family 2 protein [Candidatus Gallilactobacillus intestinavium]OAQ04963.1 hypothetical protein A3O10_03350 [Ligilactobacillus aviarius]OAQ05784.1 hypothetical protein A3O11_02015 [Ligilactobacillus aviarius]OAS79953.1 hypothetical protein A3O18_05025 [Ligilactobacillus aviarius]PEG70861.1 glycosyltransferase family 2 protein [Ligilactobacillus aviarius]